MIEDGGHPSVPCTKELQPKKEGKFLVDSSKELPNESSNTGSQTYAKVGAEKTKDEKHLQSKTNESVLFLIRIGQFSYIYLNDCLSMIILLILLMMIMSNKVMMMKLLSIDVLL